MFNLSSLSTRLRSKTRNSANMIAPITEQIALRGSWLTCRSLVDHDTSTMPPMLMNRQQHQFIGNTVCVLCTLDSSSHYTTISSTAHSYKLCSTTDNISNHIWWYSLGQWHMRVLLQTRRTKTVNITTDDITSQLSDILATCCKVISSFVIVALLVLRVCGCRP